LHYAIVAVKEPTLTIRLFLQRQPLPVSAQSRVTLDELVFGQSEESRQPRNLRFTETHLPRPSATRRATLAFVKNRHPKILRVRPKSVERIYCKN
jgi:hypothetical protein